MLMDGWQTENYLKNRKTTKDKSESCIFDFSQYEYMIVESDDGKVIAEIRQDQIDVEDGYRIRMCLRGKEA